MPVSRVNRRKPEMPNGRILLNIDDLEGLAQLITTASAPIAGAPREGRKALTDLRRRRLVS
jgi:hypothetical protein